MSRSVRATVASLALIAVSAGLGGMFGGKAEAAADSGAVHLKRYSEILAAIESQYAEEVDAAKPVASSIREMLRTLDPHSNFFEIKEFSTLQERQKGSYFGLGITIVSIEGRITVVSPFEGSPAHRLGIRAGDIIVGIEAEDARGMDIDAVVKRLRGPKGSQISIRLEREGYAQPLQFTVVRDEIPLHSVPYAFMVSKDVGYIRLVDFNETTACRPTEPAPCERDLERALRTLKEQGATSYVLDVRDNPGGLLDMAFAVSNLFLKKGQMVVYTKGRYKRDESSYITETDSPWSNVPLVVMTSRHSASASEIVAGAIQDHDRGLIVGERTFGKGLVQTIWPLRSVRGYALSLTTARYYTPSGRSIQREYGGDTALEDYQAPKERSACEAEGSDPRLTDAGRRVFGGDGIAPDTCIEPVKAGSVVASLQSRQAFVNFARRFESAEVASKTAVEGAGSRASVGNDKVRPIGPDFKVTDAIVNEFLDYLKAEKIAVDAREFDANRAEVEAEILQETLRQVFGEGVARKRLVAQDRQLQKAIESMPLARLLQTDPQRYISETTTRRVARR
ncbi:MAG: S41 family peptidase [Vicinamibacteria bacterium]|nr:S41 family peptidase [Vicinamibacteria bacterium]